MTITVALPDDITQHADPAREALEALALEGYRSGTLTQFQVGRLLGSSRFETEQFLARHVDLYDYDPSELDREAKLLEDLFGQR
jgi:predicted HTH domain antitoxin